jgi:hypothetical protein
LFIGCAVLANAIPSKSQEKAEPQLVRITYTHGEVKFSPGKNGRPSLETDWMAAPAGMTLEEGDSLATEDGEDGSTVYLADRPVAAEVEATDHAHFVSQSAFDCCSTRISLRSTTVHDR